jgi:hypothetical protein
MDFEEKSTGVVSLIRHKLHRRMRQCLVGAKSFEFLSHDRQFRKDCSGTLKKGHAVTSNGVPQVATKEKKTMRQDGA